MKKWLFLALLVLPNLVHAQEAFVITSYHTDINVNRDSSINVTETIDVEFSQERHGILRNIPLNYRDKSGNRKNLRISEISVTNQVGQPYQIDISGSSTKKIRIGDPNSYVSGQQVYVINYKIDRAINFFDGSDELYWNAVGDEWPTSISTASATVNIPESGTIQAAAFQGSGGSQEQATVNQTATTFNYQSTRPLNPYEGLTIVASWNKNIVTPPNFWQSLYWFLSDNYLVFLPIIYIFWLVRKFYRFGKDPAGRHTIVPEFAPPKLSLLGQAALKDEKLQTQDLTALIIKWAVDGNIKIKEPKKKKFTLVKIKQLENANSKEVAFFDKIFTSSEVKLSELKSGKLLKVSNELKAEVFDQLVESGHFIANPQSTRNNYLILGALVLFGSTFLFALNPASGGLTVVAGLITLILSPLMPKRTKKGVLEKEKILGFELYLKTAEKYRLEFAEKQYLFEKYLPYAIAFGVATVWAKAFKGILSKPPDWYSGVNSNSFVPLNFTKSLNSGLNSSITSSVTTASSGGSGFSGGGVGGGFGGGGGGSW